MHGIKALVEGDSYSAIQWGSSSLSYPWLLAGCVEKIRLIFCCKFLSHVNCDFNLLADGLAKVGESRTTRV